MGGKAAAGRAGANRHRRCGPRDDDHVSSEPGSLEVIASSTLFRHIDNTNVTQSSIARSRAVMKAGEVLQAAARLDWRQAPFAFR
jgi:hypothetical protein